MVDNQEFEREINYLSEHHLEGHPEQHILILFQEDNTWLEDRFPAVENEVIPDPEEQGGVVKGRLHLQDLSEQGDEVGRAVIARVDRLFLNNNSQLYLPWNAYEDLGAILR